MKNNHTRLVIGSLVAFALLAVVHTWPLAAAPAHWSRVEGDGALNIWAIGWVARTLAHHPTQPIAQMLSAPSPSTRDQCAGAAASGHVWITASSANATKEPMTSRV